jgi:hypothetical protein
VVGAQNPASPKYWNFWGTTMMVMAVIGLREAQNPWFYATALITPNIASIPHRTAKNTYKDSRFFS